MGHIFDFELSNTDTSESNVGWETRYDGALSVAVVNRVPVAGISGPWPDGNFALTWWATREIGAPATFEIYTSLEMAQKRVEAMASRASREM